MGEVNITNGRKKIVFFSKGDDNFIIDIIEKLSIQYETSKAIIKVSTDMKMIDKWMKWADICWFEWCDELLIYASKLEIAKQKKIICRLHSYEAFTYYPAQVNWECVDKLIFVSEDIQKYVIEHFKVNKGNTIVIPNGVDMSKWSYKQREPGFNVAYVGYINYKKGPMLLLHTIKAIYDKDNRYKFYIAGQFQDTRYLLYFQQMSKEFGLENNFFIEGWQKDLDNWLEDKNYILCTSVLESQNMSVMQAMAKGIKPVVHNFVGAKGIYPDEYLWNTIDEAVCNITEEGYNSDEYRSFIDINYSLEKQINAIDKMINELIIKDKENISFDYIEYWNNRLNSNFNIEGVGNFGLGEIYNKLLYKCRIDIWDGIFNKILNESRDIRVLELGPGIGIFTEYFYRKGIQDYEAIDISSKSSIELQHRYPKYQFKNGDICEDSHYEGEYDLIFCADVLLNITNENQFKKAINNISRHLCADGICIFFEPISTINTKSQSPQVIIRDKEYIEKVFIDNNLVLVDMQPVVFFMNYPFDRNLLGRKSNNALYLFNLICSIFKDTTISNQNKQIIGEYLLNRDRQLVYNNKLGLSEKLLIVQKSEINKNINFDLREILNIKKINSRLKVLSSAIYNNEIQQHNSLNKVIELVNSLED
ncbi:glycosyltransferase [Ruminiclostridium herbifermentans]|uniref:Glycosyltransferase n=1 Tax=Ruminiclostridium herbifermentans TaxID=2488810 RepID=A0A4U7JBF0_9FIRM|nr:glycosyltransferase [Ruminiclostridium herbifermentans]QNU66876.1 glycosyltransferase [Ruminiclostridium herbifermentans]